MESRGRPGLESYSGPLHGWSGSVQSYWLNAQLGLQASLKPSSVRIRTGKCLPQPANHEQQPEPCAVHTGPLTRILILPEQDELRRTKDEKDYSSMLQLVWLLSTCQKKVFSSTPNQEFLYFKMPELFAYSSVYFPFSAYPHHFMFLGVGGNDSFRLNKRN